MRTLPCLGLAATAALFVFSSWPLARAATVARVGSFEISEHEVQREYQRLLPFAKGYHGGISQERQTELRAEALQSLIRRSLMAEHGRRAGLTVSTEDFAATLAEVKQQFDTEQAFRDALGKEPLADFENSMRRELLAHQAMDAEVNAKSEVKDEELEALFTENQERYVEPKRFRASHILVELKATDSAEQKAEKRRRAEQLLGRVTAGEDFHDVAYYESDDRTKWVGGDLGYFAAGSVEEPFEKAIDELEIGRLSNVVETSFGFHIIKLVDRKEERRYAFAEVKESIRNHVLEKRRQALLERWLGELRARIPVQIISAAPEVAATAARADAVPAAPAASAPASAQER
ncbi:MAG: peptidylprolyl isomerase [Candidatus Schekmanbacteria bacterium]|nr:peptidylprolyl isomerase [Candidatus Schekmanbacteria bacterium]